MTRQYCVDARQGGFTLLEALIGLAIVATAFAVAFVAMPESARAQKAARNLEAASDLAEALLAEAGQGAAPAGTGESGAFTWRIKAGAPIGQAAPGGAIAAQNLRITVAWAEGGGTRSIAVDSVHLSTAAR